MRAIMVRGLTGCSLVVASLLAAPAAASVQQGSSGVSAATPPSRGVPNFLWTADAASAPAGSTAEQAARYHLERLHDTYRVPRTALAAAKLLYVHDTGRGGIIVGLRQKVGDVDVFHGDIKVLMDRSHNLIAVAGSPHPAINTRADFSSASSMTAAVAVALRTLYGVELANHLSSSREAPRAGFTYFDIAVPAPVDLVMRRPARVKPIFYPDGDRLRAAHYVEIQAKLRGGVESDAHAFIVDAAGTILHRKDLVAHESFNYRVYASPDGRPEDSPLEDWSPHPTGEPNGDGPSKAAFPMLIEMEGFNHNPDDQPDPWLPDGAKETLGNNVDAFVDWKDPDGLGGPLEHRAKISSLNTFDYVHDITLEPLADLTQSMSAITSLFYLNNWHHDWWYDSGFNEAAGNAQKDNFGRGGAGNDVLLAEAQDAALEGARNNANMSTPLDGESPVMQMYLWSPVREQASVHAEPLGQDFAAAPGRFGPHKYDTTAPLVLSNDGSAQPEVGCESQQDDISGKIVLAHRGGCEIEVVAQNVEAAGGVGLIVVWNGGEAFAPGSDPATADPQIPALGVATPAGDALEAALGEGPVSVTLHGDSTTERDGTIDNLIVAHEWGHYIHHRLSTCGIPQCGAQSEGWGDYNALMQALREGDDLSGTYAGSQYGTFDTRGYFGLRRAAYTIDKTKNATSFHHIDNSVQNPPPPYFEGNGIENAESHNAGEIWATMMWEAYIGLHMAHEGDLEFEQVRRRMGDYVVGGLMMAPPDPTYTEQRDAILAVASAADHDDFITIAEAFARRGAGTCAVSPDKSDATFAGVVEDFEIRPNGVIVAADLDDSVMSCDDDHVIDPTETGKIRIQVRNAGVIPMAGATLTLASSSPSLTFAGGTELDVPDLEPQGEAELDVDVSLVADAPSLEDITVTLTLATPDGCEKQSKLDLPSRLNGDIATGVSANDDVDAPLTPWILGGSEDGLWNREPVGNGNYVWHGIDFGSISDTWIESPTLEVSDSDPLVISLLHAYDFEFAMETYWDGGLIELSTDGGGSWDDISGWLDPGYTGVINNEVNPIHMRPVFGGQSPDYPAPQKLVLDLGTNFAGQDLKIRFRIGTDGFVGAPGWYIDDLEFAGITNTPFSSWIPDAGCSSSPTTGDSETGPGDPTEGPPPTTGGDDPDPTTTEDPPLVGEDPPCGCAATPDAGFFSLLGLLLLPRRRRRSA